MTRPSKGGAVFLTVFGMMFFIPGLLAAASFLANQKGAGVAGLIFGVNIALLISAIGFGLIFMAWFGFDRQKQQAAREEANPKAPWLWRADWAVRRSESLKKNLQITIWVVCILCNMVLIPLAISIVLQPAEQRNTASFIALSFCLLGLIPLAYAVRASLRHRRFGNTWFELDSLPFSPGDRVSGRVHLKLDGNPEHGIDLRLTCVRKITSGSGDNRSTVKKVLWQTGETVPLSLIGMDPFGRTIPVNFPIPADASVTRHEDPAHEILWLLHAKAALPGVDYSDEFEVPVFSTSLSASQVSAEQLGWAQTQPQSRSATLISLAVFMAFAGAILAWQGWRGSTFKSMANSRANAPRPAKPARAAVAAPVTHGAVSPMTDADVEHVLALAPQAQAEELLERVIAHDLRALELFDRQVETWVSHIRVTPRMRQLEGQSQFSTDLRVRYANADINLTLDGWKKNEQAADMLIERAKTDLQYRPAALYFLGMLAGRGVAYDKIHPVLLDYAKHDPDPNVRQWAVEGMRYLGKDEALHELFESFTEDPSDKVRERAGCNISDCGNFTRVQRMRMVPEFLRLISDSSTNAQMRTWSFMALREITDANVPSDPQTWQAWYGQHGAAKLAEFERLDWWRIRGDQ
jgi:HEAT repeats